MFFNNHKMCYEILNVYHIKNRVAKVSQNRNRTFSGIAYRVSENTLFDSQGKKYFADTGSFSFIPAQVDYTRTSTDEEIIIIRLCCHGENEKEIQIFHPESSVKFAAYFFEILKIWEEGYPGYKHKCTSVFYKLMEEMELYSMINCTNRKEQIIKDSLIYMNMNFDNPQISISKIAEKSYISEVYFRKIYKEIFGISPGKAIQNMRIEKEKELLKTGYFSVSEVSQKSGFDNVKYFSTLFNKVVGLRPSEYMKNNFE